jgi:hypothetical protein
MQLPVAAGMAGPGNGVERAFVGLTVFSLVP